MKPSMKPPTNTSVHDLPCLSLTGVELTNQVWPPVITLLPTGLPPGLSNTATVQVIVCRTKPEGMGGPGMDAVPTVGELFVMLMVGVAPAALQVIVADVLMG